MGVDPLGLATWAERMAVLKGYGKGVGLFLLAPGALTYNMTGHQLYKATGAHVYRAQSESYEAMVAAMGEGIAEQGVVKFVFEGVAAPFNQTWEAIQAGDHEAAGEAVGGSVMTAMVVAETAGGFRVGTAPTPPPTAPAMAIAAGGVRTVAGAGGRTLVVEIEGLKLVGGGYVMMSQQSGEASTDESTPPATQVPSGPLPQQPANLWTGPKAMSHLRSHVQHARETAARLGLLRPRGIEEAQQFLWRVIQMGEQRIGTWGDLGSVQMSRLGDAIVIRRMNGQYVTNLDFSKGGNIVTRWNSATPAP